MTEENVDTNIEPTTVPVNKTFTDRLVGATIVAKDITDYKKLDEETKAQIRNRIVFWSCIVGGVCQVLNLAYVFFFLK